MHRTVYSTQLYSQHIYLGTCMTAYHTGIYEFRQGGEATKMQKVSPNILNQQHKQSSFLQYQQGNCKTMDLQQVRSVSWLWTSGSATRALASKHTKSPTGSDLVQHLPDFYVHIVGGSNLGSSW